MDTMIQSEIAAVVVLVASGEPEKALVQPEAWPSQPLVDCCLLTVSNFILLVQSNGSSIIQQTFMELLFLARPCFRGALELTRQRQREQ